MRNVTSVVAIVFLVIFFASCRKPERETISISGTVDLYHLSNVEGEDWSDVYGFETCEPQGKIPEDGIYGQLTISLDAESIGVNFIPAIIPEHVFSGTFGDRGNLFEDGNPITGVGVQYIPGGGCRYAVLDRTYDDGGYFVNPSVVMGIPCEVENGTAELGNVDSEEVTLFVTDFNELGVECIHAIGKGEIEIND